jgi:hypothetical protein
MRIRVALLAACLLALPAFARAEYLGSMTLNKIGWLNGERMLPLRFQAQITPTVVVTQYKSGYGAFRMVKTSGTGPIGSLVPNGIFDAFCMDLRDWLAPATTFYEIRPLGDSPNGGPMPPAKQELLRELWGRYYQSIYTGTAIERRNKTEAFSLAVWEIGYEKSGKLDVTNGPGFWFQQQKALGTPAVAALANAWLASLNGQGPKWDVWSLVPLTGATKTNVYQDLMFGLPVPEPGCLAMLAGSGLLVAAGVICRRQRRAA